MIDPLEHLLGYQLRRASAVMMADLARTLEPFALRPTDASVLLAIAANPSATQSEIGRLLSIQRANMAPIAATLLARGLIDRSVVDGRSHGMRLSTDGHDLAVRVDAAIAAHEARFLSDLAGPGRTLFMAHLRAVRNGTRSATAPIDPAS